MKKNLFKIIPVIILMIISDAIIAQGKLIMNGGVVNITNGAVLVIDNADNTAIIYNGTGYIQSEGAGNEVIWNIGAGNGSKYTIPFGIAANYLPVSFIASSGSADGYFIFSTYPTATWKNSDDLPPGVTNVTANGLDNSSKIIDRFWQISPQGFATKPDLTNLTLTYSDAEYAPPNSIVELSLISQRWNNVLMTWSDFIPSSAINTGNNTVVIASVASNQLYNWWTLVDASSPLPVTLIDFRANAGNHKVTTYWQTTSEINTSRFEVFRSKDGDHFELAGLEAAAGNSNSLLHYEFIDDEPFSGISYYRLKTVDRDGGYVWSKVVKISLEDESLIMLYPNPAHNYLTLQVDNSIVAAAPIASVYDAKGSFVYSFKITGTSTQINISGLPQGSYQITFKISNAQHTLSFIKK